MLSSCRDFFLQVKRDMVAIKHELDTVQQVKEEIEELREYVDRLEEHTHRRKLRLLEQVSEIGMSIALYATTNDSIFILSFFFSLVSVYCNFYFNSIKNLDFACIESVLFLFS